MAATVRVYPVPGVMAVGYAAVEQEVSREEAKAYIATGAFALTAKDAERASPWSTVTPEEKPPAKVDEEDN